MQMQSCEANLEDFDVLVVHNGAAKRGHPNILYWYVKDEALAVIFAMARDHMLAAHAKIHLLGLDENLLPTYYSLSFLGTRSITGHIHILRRCDEASCNFL